MNLTQTMLLRCTRIRPDPGGVFGRLAYACVLVVVLLCPGRFAGAADYRELPIDEGDRQHWSFRPLQRVTVPLANFPDWCRNEIDHFTAAALLEAGLTAQPQAPGRTLLRRLSLDLVGLPPTPDQITAFLSDPDDIAYTRLTDRLLDSIGYGERWAQHWLDLARFAETDGFEFDATRPTAWRFRDWVIQALNADMPYDEFIRRQIAGDELYPNDASAVTATQFCLAGPDMPDINLPEERRHTLLNDITSTVSEVILGLQLGCAQCHDHKYDPVSLADFYRMRAIFEPAVQLQYRKSVSTLQEQFPYEQSAHIMLRGDFRRPGPAIGPGVLRVVSPPDHTFRPQATQTSAGRRTAFAEWLVSPDNPLTARVIVNRVWQHHFGQGLVDTPSDFGLMGAYPTHEELLDWLAGWLIENGWSLKKLHRLIVSSATYRQRSKLPEEASETERGAWEAALSDDPEGTLLSRYPRWRLEGEAIRDALLVAADRLNRKSGGPGVRPPLPQELTGTLHRNQWNVTSDSSEHERRSIYVFSRRNLPFPIFEMFDRPSSNSSCPSRNMSTTAPQALHLLNSEFALRMARHMSASISETNSDTRSQIEFAFLRTLGRLPMRGDIADVGDFLQHHSAIAADDKDPLTHLCLALLNSNEFVFVD